MKITFTKKQAAFRQIEAAIDALLEDKFDIAITLAGAAEGMAPEGPNSIFRTLVDAEKRPEHLTKKEWISIINWSRDWLKHPTEELGDTHDFNVDEAAHMILRALQRWEPWSPKMQEFKDWYMGRIDQEKANRTVKAPA